MESRICIDGECAYIEIDTSLDYLWYSYSAGRLGGRIQDVYSRFPEVNELLDRIRSVISSPMLKEVLEAIADIHLEYEERDYCYPYFYLDFLRSGREKPMMTLEDYGCDCVWTVTSFEIEPGSDQLVYFEREMTIYSGNRRYIYWRRNEYVTFEIEDERGVSSFDSRRMDSMILADHVSFDSMIDIVRMLRIHPWEISYVLV